MVRNHTGALVRAQKGTPHAKAHDSKIKRLRSRSWWSPQTPSWWIVWASLNVTPTLVLTTIQRACENVNHRWLAFRWHTLPCVYFSHRMPSNVCLDAGAHLGGRDPFLTPQCINRSIRGHPTNHCPHSKLWGWRHDIHLRRLECDIFFTGWASYFERKVGMQSS